MGEDGMDALPLAETQNGMSPETYGMDGLVYNYDLFPKTESFVDYYFSLPPVQGFLDSVQAVTSNPTILDLGSGVGIESAKMQELLPEARVFSADISTAGSRHGRKVLLLDQVQADVNYPPYNKSVFTGIHCKDVLVHIPDKEHFIEGVSRLLEEGGYLLLVSSPRSYEILGQHHWDQEDLIQMANQHSLRLQDQTTITMEHEDWYSGKSDRAFLLFEKRSEKGLTLQTSAEIFGTTLDSLLAEDSPFAGAPFLRKIAEKYFADEDKTSYFNNGEFFGASISVENGVAHPFIDLDFEEGQKSRLLRKRVGLRLGKENPTDEEIFRFAVGHELGHLIQGVPEFEDVDDYDLTGFTEADIKVLEWQLDRANERIRKNPEIASAREHFRSLFKDDVDEEFQTPEDPDNYSDEEYLRYVNSSMEINADFIALWIMGMSNPEMKTCPQNEGYHLEDWQKWAEDHRVNATQLT